MRGRLEQAESLVSLVGELFQGEDPGVVGAVLATLTTKWLLLHSCDDPAETKKARARLLLKQMDWIVRGMEQNETRLRFVEPKGRA